MIIPAYKTITIPTTKGRRDGRREKKTKSKTRKGRNRREREEKIRREEDRMGGALRRSDMAGTHPRAEREVALQNFSHISSDTADIIREAETVDIINVISHLSNQLFISLFSSRATRRIQGIRK